MAEYTITECKLYEQVPAGASVHLLVLDQRQYKEQCTNDNTRDKNEKRIAIACGDLVTVKRAGKEDLSGKVKVMYPLRPDFDYQNHSFTSGAEADSKNNSDALLLFFS